MKYLSDCQVSLDSLISRDWVISPQNEADILRDQTLDSIHVENGDKVLSALQIMHARYEQSQVQKQKDKL